MARDQRALTGCTERMRERQAGQKAGSKDTNDEEALLAISHRNTVSQQKFRGH